MMQQDAAPARAADLPRDAIRNDPVPPIATHSIGWDVARDLVWVAVIAGISLGLGLARNHFSSQPLPMVYRSPEQRLEAELTTLVNTPPVNLAPAETLALPEFRSVVDNKTALILDARSSVFFQQGHVPAALNLARDNFAQDYRRLSPVLKGMNDKPIIVYCSGGYCHDSKMVAHALMMLGFDNVRVFTGGWDEWS